MPAPGGRSPRTPAEWPTDGADVPVGLGSSGRGWDQWSFRANKWQHINQQDRKLYQKNAYRVQLTRDGQGRVSKNNEIYVRI